MTTTCTRCEGTGFLNIEQVPDTVLEEAEKSFDFCQHVLKWLIYNAGQDVQVCDCCGNGESWYGIPGEHYNDDDPPGHKGPYAYNGGLCECD